jgi:hypothetical protein
MEQRAAIKFCVKLIENLFLILEWNLFFHSEARK